jgi:hypothetical protein
LLQRNDSAAAYLSQHSLLRASTDARGRVILHDVYVHGVLGSVGSLLLQEKQALEQLFFLDSLWSVFTDLMNWMEPD